MNENALQQLMDDKELNELIDRYLEDYRKHCDKSIVKNTPMPIIWFGDLAAYQKSACKVVTVGINPSCSEFPEDDRFYRFPAAKKLNCKSENFSEDDKRCLVSSYNDYFNVNPYVWFRDNRNNVEIDKKYGFESVLGYLFFDENKTVSYDKSPSKNHYTAIHIDLQTALATDPVWSKIEKKEKPQKNELAKTGEKLFDDFIKYLKPNVLILSSNQDELKKLLKKYTGKKNYDSFYDSREEGKGAGIRGYKIEEKLFIFGSGNSGGPFRSISREKWKDFIKALRQEWESCNPKG